MTGFRSSRILLVIAATLFIGAVAWAEITFPVNDPGIGNWVFDQPSVAANGSTLHVAFVGDNSAGANDPSLDTRLCYAAINGSADFTNKATTRAQVLVTPPVVIDNGDSYTGARHPQIVVRSATQMVILFQAVPAGDTNFKLFRALVAIDNNTVKSQQVNEVKDPFSGRMAGVLVDPSFGMVVSDNTLRVAYTDNATGVGNVYFARVGADNAFLVGSSILLSSQPGSRGFQPLPRLRLDGLNNSHIVWAANNSPGIASPTGGIYYAMVQTASPGAADNIAIGATQVLSGGLRFGFPNVLLANSSNQILVFAADDPFGSEGLAGSLGIAQLNPYAVTRDGNPVDNTAGSNSLFFLNPPGAAVLASDFDVYRPEAFIDGQLRLHVAGYGFRSSLPLPGTTSFPGTPGRYYAMSVGSTSSSVGTASVFASMVSSPVSIGSGPFAFAMQIPGDYTRPAFAHLSSKAVHFWSGPDDVLAGDTGARNLYVTSALDSPDNPPTKQSGCSMVSDPGRGQADRIPGAAVLLLPAVLLALRRSARKAFGR